MSKDKLMIASAIVASGLHKRLREVTGQNHRKSQYVKRDKIDTNGWATSRYYRTLNTNQKPV
jgi:hypothetical protein